MVSKFGRGVDVKSLELGGRGFLGDHPSMRVVYPNRDRVVD